MSIESNFIVNWLPLGRSAVSKLAVFMHLDEIVSNKRQGRSGYGFESHSATSTLLMKSIFQFLFLLFPPSPSITPPVILVVVFAICWAPFHTQRLMWSFISHWSDGHYQIFEYVHVISGVLFYISSAVNPILYNLMSTRFREMFKEVMCHRAHHSAPRNHSLSVTRVTLRSTLSVTPLSNGTAVVEGEEEGEGEGRVTDETRFAESTRQQPGSEPLNPPRSV